MDTESLESKRLRLSKMSKEAAEKWRESGCTGKRRHLTPESANIYNPTSDTDVSWSKKRGIRKVVTEPYQCVFCGFWHAATVNKKRGKK